MGLSTYEKEFWALLRAVKRWKHYLQGHHFVIKTDQQSLKYLLDQKITTALQHKWVAKLMGMDYEILYKKGVENKVVDALSRRSHDNEINAVTQVVPQWINEVQKSYDQDTKIHGIIAEKILDGSSNTDYSYNNEILRWKGRICIGDQPDIKLKIIQYLHDSATGVHSRMHGTYQRARSLFY